MTSNILLCLNIDHIATLRQVRGGREPSILEAAQIAEEAGADGITVHLREDRRHIQDSDVEQLKPIVKGRLTLEMAATAEMFEIAQKIKPNLLTIVPEKRSELTTEGGLNVINNAEYLKDFLKKIHENGLEASLFIEPDLKTIEIAHQIGAKRIELHTGQYANTLAKTEINKLSKAAEFAHSLGFVVNAGHGLNINNLKPILQIPHLRELHIGHSIIARAVFIGLKQAISELKALI